MSEHSSYIQNSLTSSTSKEVILAIQNLSFAYALAPNSKFMQVRLAFYLDQLVQASQLS